MTNRLVYNIIYTRLDGDDDDYHAVLRCIPTDTLAGVYVNMIEHNLTPSECLVILGTKVDLDQHQFDALYQERRRGLDAVEKERRRQQYLRLKEEFRGDD